MGEVRVGMGGVEVGGCGQAKGGFSLSLGHRQRYYAFSR